MNPWLLPSVFFLSACGPAPRPNQIVLSYSEDNDNCIGCPSYRITFQSGGHVHFEGVKGCAIPGDRHHIVPAARFQELLQLFRNQRFFRIARIDATHIWTDVRVIRLTYRDDRIIHETVDANRQHASLTKLEKRFRDLTEVDRYLKPSLPFYRKLIGTGWNVNTAGRDGENALTSAVQSGDIEVARFLLQSGSTITPETFGHAAVRDNLELLRLIIEAPNLERKTDPKSAALARAAGNAKPEVLLYLLKSGADPNGSHATRGHLPLVSAISGGRLKNAELLLAAGANPNATDPDGRPLLWYAATATNSGFIPMLLRAKANINATDSQGQTALKKTADYCNAQNMRVLLQAGADPTIADKKGKTVLQSTFTAEPNCQAAKQVLHEFAPVK